MKRTVFLISVFSLIIFSGFGWSKPPVNPPANVHPRLYFTGERLETIRTNLSAEENQYALRETEFLINYIKLKDFDYRKSSSKNGCDGKFIAGIEACAFKGIVEENPDYFNDAYKALVSCAENIKLVDVYDTYRPYGQIIFTVAEVYDWGFNYLDAKQKKKLVSIAYKYAGMLQMGFPEMKQGAVSGHGCESQLLKSLLAAGVAFYDAKNVFWKEAGGRFYEQYVPVRKYIYKSKAPINQGAEYGPYRSVFDLYACLIITGMGEADPYDGLLKEWDTYYINFNRPDEIPWPAGDDKVNNGNKPPYSRISTNLFLHSAITGNPYEKFYAKKLSSDFSLFTYNTNGENDGNLSPVEFLIFNDVNLKPADYTELDTVYYMPSPVGEYFARESWASDAAAVHAKIGELYSANHEHRDAGTFEIFCNGPLASNSGYYLSGGGSGGYKSGHTQKYFHSTVARNGLLLESTDKENADSGDQESLADANPDLKTWLATKDYKRASVTLYSDKTVNGIRSVFLRGDITNAYKNAKKVTRSMLTVFTGEKENPLIFVVYDKIQSGWDRRGVYLLHSQVKPVVDGNVISVMNGGYLENTILYPEKPEITIIGGNGKEWWIKNKNYDEGRSSLKRINEAGWGRVEIRSSNQDEKETVFLNVIQAAPSIVNFEKPSVKKIEGNYIITSGKYVIRIPEDMTQDAEITLNK